MMPTGQIIAKIKAVMTRFINPIFTQRQNNVSGSVKWSQLVSVISLPDLHIKSRVNQNKGHMLCLGICSTMHIGKKLFIGKHQKAQPMNNIHMSSKTAEETVLFTQSPAM